MIPGSVSHDRLPESFRTLFWDCDFDRLKLSESIDFMVGRVLVNGSWHQICWLRETLGDARIRQWILDHHGRVLDRKQLRFWELVLDLPNGQVARWIANRSDAIWDNRICP